jgi:hypothetical protein
MRVFWILKKNCVRVFRILKKNCEAKEDVNWAPSEGQSRKLMPYKLSLLHEYLLAP